jgi:hypothetical protein
MMIPPRRGHIAHVIYGVAVISLYPGLVRTEAVVAAAAGDKFWWLPPLSLETA